MLKGAWAFHDFIFIYLFIFYFLHFSLRTFIRGIWNSILIFLRYFNFFPQSPSFLPPPLFLIFWFFPPHPNVLSLKGCSLLSLSQHQFSLSAFSWKARNDFFFNFLCCIFTFPAYELKHTLNIVDDDDRTSILKGVSWRKCT